MAFPHVQAHHVEPPALVGDMTRSDLVDQLERLPLRRSSSGTRLFWGAAFIPTCRHGLLGGALTLITRNRRIELRPASATAAVHGSGR
jgi:hypothetical protein